MEYTSKLGDRPNQAHVNYKCPCGCVAGLTYDREAGSEHLGMCCCGRLLWVGTEAESVIRDNYADGREYELNQGSVVLPWGESQAAVLAVPLDALVNEQAKRDAGKTPTKVVDPVCGMMFDPEVAASSSRFKGSTYYFCAPVCKEKFDAMPRSYVQTKGFLERLLRRG